MGWKNKNKSKKNKKADEKRPEKPARAHKEHYDDIIKENKDFEKYYKRQGIVSDEEWPEFLAAFQRPLPTTFRLTGYRSQAEALLRIIQGNYFQDLMKVEGEGEEKIVPVNLPWYPNNFGWQLNLSRKDIRKSEALFRLHNFLVAETATGNISRQEAVSMIPPLVLDVKPHHKVLDMCAAPGSKTAQLIEMLHMDEENVIPSGLVVANDADNKRCYMLVHQTKRLQSPCFVIVNHDATVLPTIQVSSQDGKTVPLKFDRILCDVPCSGDGTLRKNVDVWMKFNTANGNNLHGIQYRIAKRAIELLEVGGQMVYSTCSLNPIEDEAVIARLIKWGKGSLELVDASEKLQGLVFRRGISHWIPMNKELQEFTKVEDVPDKDANLIRPHIFPPTSEEAESLHLDRCIRVLPHLQDTGGFFIALVKKVACLPWEKDANDPWKAVQEPGKEPPNKKRRRVWGFKEDPFVYFREDEPVWPEIRDFYGLEDLDPKNLFSRTHEDKKKNIYVSSPAIRSILTMNEDKVKIINTGVKILIRCDNKGTDCAYRLAQEGAHVTALLMKKRRVKMEKEDLIRLLMIDEGEPPAELQGLSASTKESLTALSTGSVMLEYHHDEPAFTIHLAAWKGNSSLRAYVSRQERIHYLTMVGADVSKFETNKFLAKKEEVAGQDSSEALVDEESEVGVRRDEDSEVGIKEEEDLEVGVEKEDSEESAKVDGRQEE